MILVYEMTSIGYKSSSLLGLLKDLPPLTYSTVKAAGL